MPTSQMPNQWFASSHRKTKIRRKPPGSGSGPGGTSSRNEVVYFSMGCYLLRIRTQKQGSKGLVRVPNCLVHSSRVCSPPKKESLGLGSGQRNGRPMKDVDLDEGIRIGSDS